MPLNVLLYPLDFFRLPLECDPRHIETPIV